MAGKKKTATLDVGLTFDDSHDVSAFVMGLEIGATVLGYLSESIPSMISLKSAKVAMNGLAKSILAERENLERSKRVRKRSRSGAASSPARAASAHKAPARR